MICLGHKIRLTFAEHATLQQLLGFTVKAPTTIPQYNALIDEAQARWRDKGEARRARALEPMKFAVPGEQRLALRAV